MGTEFGRDLFGERVFGTETPTRAAETVTRAPYRLELRDEDGGLLCWLGYWVDAKWEQSANEPSRLSLTYPFDDAQASLITFPNVVWLYDETGVVLDQFRVMRRTPRHASSGALLLDVEAEGLLGQLGPMSGVIDYGAVDARQSVTLGAATGGTFTLTYGGATTTGIAYDARNVDVEEALEALSSIGAGNVRVTGDAGGPWEVTFQGTLGGQAITTMTADGSGLEGEQTVTIAATVTGRSASTTVQDIVADLLSLQSGDLPVIRLGKIAAAIGTIEVNDFQIEHGRILEGLRSLQNVAGGWFGVDRERRLNWYLLSAKWTGQQIRFNRHMRALSVSYDYSRIRTRVRVIGEGLEEGARVEATANGSAEAIALYGTIEEVVVDKSIWNEEQAEAYAEALVARLETPEKTVSVDAIDLSKADCSRLDWSHAALALGTRVRLVDDDLDEEVDTSILTISRSLRDPMNVRIEVSDEVAGNPTRRRPDLLDAIANLGEMTETLAGRDWGVSRSVRELNLDDGTTFPEVARVFTDESETPDAYKDGDLLFQEGANAQMWERGEASDIVTVRALRQCPDAITETEITPSSTSFRVASGGQEKLPRDADAPFWVSVYAGDYETREAIPVSAVADRTFTIGTGMNQIQSIRLGLATGGTFALTYDGQTTGNIAWNASAATVQTALEALSNVAPGDMTVTAAGGNGWDIELAGNLAQTNAPVMTGDGTNLTGDTTVEVWISRDGGTFAISRIWPAGSWLKRVNISEPTVCSLLWEGNGSEDGGLQDLLNAMERCPDATLKTGITSASSSFVVNTGDSAHLPENDECPFTAKLYNAGAAADEADYDVYELVTVSAVDAETETYTMSARGAGDSTAMCWAAGTAVKVTAIGAEEEEPLTLCDIVTSDNIIDTLGDQIEELTEILEGSVGAEVGDNIQMLSEDAHVAGTSVKAAREDHAHWALSSTAEIQPVGPECEIGDSDYVARDDHIHALYTHVDTSGELASLDLDYGSWAMVDADHSVWLCVEIGSTKYWQCQTALRMMIEVT